VVGEKRRSHAWLWWPLLAVIAAAMALVYLFPGGFPRGQWSGGSAVSGAERSADSQSASAPGELTAVGVSSDSAASNAAGAVHALDAASSTAGISASAAGAGSTPVGGASSADTASAVSAASAARQPGAAVPPTKDSQLAFAVAESGKPTLTATVGSEAEKTQLVDELTKRLGQYNYAANIAVDPATKPAGWLPRLDGLMPLMSVPGAELRLDGTHVELSGAAANARLGWLNTLKSLFGAPYEIGTFDADNAIQQATANFRSAIKALLAPGATCAAADVAKVLNLQVINFTSASAHVPTSAAEDLNQSARVLNACARNGRAAKLEVAGYSDNVGGEQANLQLSKQRAEAVRTYLVKTGAPVDSLSAQGYGQAHPIQPNDTASGRFANRRIEFVAQ
jgi:outer membrane protein OmpA-like peptidoglycan-associated protein